MQKHKVDSQLR